jgi:predicted glycogen debranching enzyme
MTEPIPISFGPQVCGALSEGAQREWLIADGLGGFAMGTVSGLRTRRYHGLLTVAGDPPATRQLGLAALDPVLSLPSGAEIRLGVHEWASGALEPQGHRYLERFKLADGLPCWRWRVGGVVLERTLAMQHGAPSVAVVHRLVSGGSGGPVRLRVDALCTWRDAHGERHADGALELEPVADGAVVAGAYRLGGPNWQPRGEWYFGVHAREEAARGLAADEDLWFAGSFAADLEVGDRLEVSAWAGDLATVPPPARRVVAAARDRHRRLITSARPSTPAQATLALAADAFIIAGPEVIAGYPWFGAWSRDTMTSYEGLFLTTGRAAEGRQLLTRYATTVSQGMLANTADTGQTEYNTADATLWYLHALGRHLADTGDRDLAAELLPTVEAIVAAHVAGTRYDIHIDPGDGLLTQGQPGYALTWMDARVDGIGITPRIGKAVELNALWINGLAVARRLRAVLGKDAADLQALEARARAGFAARFPTPDGTLYDVVDGPAGDDPTLRPNQLLALSLPDGPGGGSPAAQVAAELLTPLGLRSLSPGSAGYRGAHRGGPADRDRAYHQGTVWPWLIGPLVDADARADTDLGPVLTGIQAHLLEYGLGSVSETADGDAPHAATGCPFQAWSVAEALRAMKRLEGQERQQVPTSNTAQ